MADAPVDDFGPPCEPPCDEENCFACGMRECPEGEPLHRHHDGCPACALKDEAPAPATPTKGPRLTLVPVTLREACAFIVEHHRHHDPPRGCILTVACAEGERVCGVAVVGRPSARMLQDGYTAEVTRVATDGTKNACSILYAAAWRACRALGYRRLVTYTLPEEGGTSLRASGWTCIGAAGGGTWSRTDRPRVDTHPTQEKLRWEMTT